MRRGLVIVSERVQKELDAFRWLGELDYDAAILRLIAVYEAYSASISQKERGAA